MQVRAKYVLEIFDAFINEHKNMPFEDAKLLAHDYIRNYFKA